MPSRSSSPFRKAAGRLSLRLAGDDPAPDQIVTARCLQRHDISRLPQIKGDKPKRGKFSACPIGYLHVEMPEPRSSSCKRTQRDGNLARLPPPTDRGCPLQDPYRAHRQRHPVQHAGRWRIALPVDPGSLANGEPFWAPGTIQSPDPQAGASLDQRSGRTDEPDDQGGNGQALLLRKPRLFARAPRQPRSCL